MGAKADAAPRLNHLGSDTTRGSPGKRKIHTSGTNDIRQKQTGGKQQLGKTAKEKKKLRLAIKGEPFLTCASSWSVLGIRAPASPFCRCEADEADREPPLVDGDMTGNVRETGFSTGCSSCRGFAVPDCDSNPCFPCTYSTVRDRPSQYTTMSGYVLRRLREDPSVSVVYSVQCVVRRVKNLGG